MASYLPEPSVDSVPNCEVCVILGAEETKADYFCMDCNNHLCQTCKEKHNKDKLFASHELKPFIPALNQTTMCKSHSTVDALYWCQKCNQPICTACVLTDHSDHRKENIKKFIAELMDDSLSVEQIMLSNKEEIEGTKDALNGAIETVSSKFSESEAAVRDHCTGMMSSILTKKNDLIAQLEEIHKCKFDNFSNTLDQEDQKLGKIETWLKQKNELLSVTTQNINFIHLTNLTKQGRRIAAKCKSDGIIEDVNFPEFIPSQTVEIGVLGEEGDVLIEEEEEEEEESGSDVDDAASCASETPSQDAENIDEKPNKQKQPRQRKQKKPKEQHQPEPKSQIPDGSLVCNINIEGRVFGVPGRVFGVRFIGDTKLAILLSNSITIYNMTTEGMRIQLQEAGNFPQKLNFHVFKAMAFHGGTGRLYLTCSQKSCSPIHEYNVSRSTFVEGSKWRGSILDPCGIAVSTSSRVVVADLAPSHTGIFVHNADGTLLHALRGQGPNPRISTVQSHPDNICCDGNENVYVSDGGSGTIFLYSNNGSLNRKLNGPHLVRSGGLCAYDGGNLLVGDLQRKVVIEIESRRHYVLPPFNLGTGQPKFIDYRTIIQCRLLALVDTSGPTAAVRIFQLDASAGQRQQGHGHRGGRDGSPGRGGRGKHYRGRGRGRGKGGQSQEKDKKQSQKPAK